MVRAALHSRAQYKYERATHSRFPFTNVMGRVRVCLTLMPGQSANADCRRAPGRHLWFTDVIPGGPFATRAHASNVAGNRTSFVHSNRSGWRMIDARVRHGWNSQARPGCRREMVRFAQNIKLQQMANRRCTSGSPVWISAFSPWLHRADTCTSCQVSARFRPRTMTDSPALHPLHSTAAIRKQRRSAFASFRRPQTVETVRTDRAPPKKQSTNGREASPDQGTSPRCFARARHRNRPRGSARPKHRQ
jgi:hypothetical protein